MEYPKKWTVTTYGRGSFEYLICASFEDALDHALDTPIEYSKPVIKKEEIYNPIYQIPR